MRRPIRCQRTKRFSGVLTQYGLLQGAHELVQPTVVLLRIGQQLAQALHGERGGIEQIEALQQHCLQVLIVEGVNVRAWWQIYTGAKANVAVELFECDARFSPTDQPTDAVQQKQKRPQNRSLTSIRTTVWLVSIYKKSRATNCDECIQWIFLSYLRCSVSCRGTPG